MPYDPTKTTGIRLAFVRDVNRRFRALKKAMKVLIVDENFFGFGRPKMMAFTFETEAAKIDAFMEWLVDMEEQGILEMVYRPGTLMRSGWTGLYVESSYRKGVQRAYAELGKVGYVPPVPLVAALTMPIHARRLELLYTRTFEDLKTVMAVTKRELRNLLTDTLRERLTLGDAEGKNPKVVANELLADLNDRIDGVGLARARMIARTEVIRAHHLATIETYEQASEEMQVQIMAELSTAGDGRVCATCAGLASGGPYTLQQIRPMIPVHPNCVTGNTIIAAEDCQSAFAATYSGPIVKMGFTNGARLAVTANHMLATPNGFVMAKFLSEGDAVLGCPEAGRALIGDPDDDRNPARIDQVVSALTKAGGVTTRCMPVTAEDLHGDGVRCEGDVDVVDANGLLSDHFHAQLVKSFDQLHLQGRCIGDILAGERPLTFLGKAALRATGGVVGGSREALAFLGGCLLHAQKHGFAAVSRDDAAFLEALGDDVAVAAKMLRELLDGPAGVIQLQDIVRVYRETIGCVATVSQRYTGLEHPNLDGIALLPSIAVGDLPKRLSGLIAPVGIVSVEIEHVIGLRVYDVATTATIYLANGILSSNCRCAAIPAAESVELFKRGRHETVEGAVEVGATV